MGGEEIVITKTPATAAAAALTLAILFHQHADGKTNQRTNVGGQSAIGGGDRDQLIHPAQAG